MARSIEVEVDEWVVDSKCICLLALMTSRFIAMCLRYNLIYLYFSIYEYGIT